MARILVTGPVRGLADRDLLDRIVARIRDDGHDGFRFGTQDETALQAIKDADAVVAVLDGAVDGGTATVLGLATAHGKPRLALRTRGARPLPEALQDVVDDVVEADDEAEWFAALPPFYEQVRPFAGRLVRDLVPRLVREAGHEVFFRRLTDAEKPRFLKQKVAQEARDLSEADLTTEKEEIADVLEALEALIQVRGYDRESLKQVKQGKRKRRGGFEQCFVVEATSLEQTRRPHATEPPGPVDDPAKAQTPTDDADPDLGGDAPLTERTTEPTTSDV